MASAITKAFDQLKNTVRDLHLENRIEALAVSGSPRFGSSRFLLTVGVIAALVWFFRGQITPVLGMIEHLVIALLVCRTATDVVTIAFDGLIKHSLAKNLSKDGTLSPDEVKELAAVTPPPAA